MLAKSRMHQCVLKCKSQWMFIPVIKQTRSMTIIIVRKLASVQDLVDIEGCLRTMYNTADGTTCQALLTMEYQCWRNSVIRQLLSTAEDTTNMPDIDAVREDTDLLSHLPGSLQAFLGGFKIVYAQKTCVILQLLPAVCAQMHRKRPPPLEEIDQQYRKRTESA